MGSDLKLNLEKFVTRMLKVAKDFTITFLGGLDERINVFALQIRQQRLPEYLKPQEIFLGKYLIIDVIPYSKIISEKLMRNRSVFKLKIQGS